MAHTEEIATAAFLIHESPLYFMCKWNCTNLRSYTIRGTEVKITSGILLNPIYSRKRKKLHKTSNDQIGLFFGTDSLQKNLLLLVKHINFVSSSFKNNTFYAHQLTSWLTSKKKGAMVFVANKQKTLSVLLSAQNRFMLIRSVSHLNRKMLHPFLF